MFFRKKSSKNQTTLENDNKQLELQVMTLLDQMENFKKISFKYQEEYNKLSKATKEMCLILLDSQYAESQIGGYDIIRDMDIFQLIEYGKSQYRESQVKDRELLLNLTKQIQEKNAQIESLKAQISQELLKEQHMKEYEEDIIKEETVEKEIEKTKSSSPIEEKPKGVARVLIMDEDTDVIDTPKEKLRERERTQKRPEPKNIQKPNRDNEVKRAKETIENFKNRVEKNKKDDGIDIKTHLVDLNDYIDKLTNPMWDIILSIGRDGLSESKDIKKQVVNKDVTESSYNTALSQLRKMNLIEQEKINTGWRWFHAYELSSIGKRIYLEKYKESSVECEKQILKKEHTSALHGYCIKDTAQILKAVFGYDEAVTDRKYNTIKLHNGEKYIPDVIAKKKEGSLVDYFEVELGHHTQKDFNKKCDKMRMVTRNIHFVVPDIGTMDRILARQIGQWVLEKGGKDKLAGTTVYLTTLTKLNEGKWERVYPF